LLQPFELTLDFLFGRTADSEHLKYSHGAMCIYACKQGVNAARMSATTDAHTKSAQKLPHYGSFEPLIHGSGSVIDNKLISAQSSAPIYSGLLVQERAKREKSKRAQLLHIAEAGKRETGNGEREQRRAMGAMGTRVAAQTI
jgi:hypothetical protein